MTDQTAHEELDDLLMRLRLEHTIEDMQAEIDAEIDGRTPVISEAATQRAMQRVQALIDRFERGEPIEESDPAAAVASDSSLWRRVREGVDFLVLSLDGLLGAGPAPAAGYRRGTSAAEPALPEEVPFTEGDIWRPLLPPETKAGYWFFSFRYSGSGTPVEPELELHIDDVPAEGAVLFRPEQKELTVRIADPSGAPETLEVATPDAATLAVRLTRKA